eukprot:scaffold7561_cov227-Skeletonema_dohrnii-CCMP3373.AAC.2
MERCSEEDSHSTCDFKVDSERSYNAMRVMTAALRNLQQISICSLGRGHKFSDGEDPNEELARRTAHLPTQDINIISSFRKLRALHIDTKFLNGRYPALFDFPLLEKLSIKYCNYLKFDLDMLEGLPLLKELNLVCDKNPHFTGNLKSLRVLKDTLEKVEIDGRLKIRGNFMDLADFPRLEVLCLRDTKVKGDIRNIGEDDFLALKSLSLPKRVRGGMCYQFQSISDVPSFMHTIHVLLQRTPTLFKRSDRDLSDAFGWRLSEDSPDWYGGGPFYLQFIREGSRLGWSWYYGCRWTPRDERYSCETNWLDTEPSREGSSDYKTYIEELQRIIEELACPIDYYMDFYRGYYEPPTVEEYRRLCEGRWDTF